MVLVSNTQVSQMFIYNKHGHLEELPPTLQLLYVNDNNITALPELPFTLEELYCDNNQLTFLPELPSSLKILHCSDNQITNLPKLPSSLKVLHCNNNQLTSLPELPPTLEVLYCSENQLSNLPKLPSSLKILYCNKNQLTFIPDLPSTLDLLCNNNHLLYNRYTPQCINDSNTKLNKFRFIFYILKYKPQFKKWLWVNVREKKAIMEMAPIKIENMLKEGMDLDDIYDFLQQKLSF